MGSFYADPVRYECVTAALSGAGPVDFYRALVEGAAGPVLELACGTGRLAIPLAEAGAEVVGLDASAEMLEVGRSRTARVEWVQGDMRQFDLGRRFGIVFIASNSFCHLHTLADVEACLRSVKRHLTESGRFVVDVFNPAPGLFVRDPEYRSAVTSYADPRTRGRVAVSKTVRYDSAAQVSRETWFFFDEGTGEEAAVPLELRMFFPQELDALLRYNGFGIEAKYGDYERSPFGPLSRKQIVVTRIAEPQMGRT